MQKVVPSILLFVGILTLDTDAVALPPQKLRGSPESLATQNNLADQFGLPRVTDGQMLKELISKKHLVPIPETTKTFYHEGEPELRYALPSTQLFLQDLAEKHFHVFGKKLKITSLVRTEEYQKILIQKKISDADGESPERRSAHLTGAALDISKRPMDPKEISWMRRELLKSKRTGLVEAVEEIYNNAFHIFVVPTYSSLPPEGKKESIKKKIIKKKKKKSRKLRD